MKRMIDCAMKREKSNLVIKNVTLLNLFTGEEEVGDLAVAEGKIVAFGQGYCGETEVDGSGLYALPGFLDAHVHVESSLLSPEAFATLASAHGTTGIVADPHEITNVCGIQGAEYMAEAFARLTENNGVAPIDVYLQLPSCVPATPFETSGAIIDGEETQREIARPLFHGLGEMMNFPAVIGGEEDCLKKLTATHGAGKVIDGHAPALSGEALNAYACAGIRTDHEPLNREECLEKVARGMYVQLRNGSSAQNITENCKAVNGYNYRRFLLCSDDKNVADLTRNGHMDGALRKMVACGVPAAMAVATATLNVAECYGLQGKGALAPGYDADIVLVEDLQEFTVRYVFKKGTLVAKDGVALFDGSKRYLPQTVKDTVRVKEVTEEQLKLPVNSGRARVMRMIPYSLVTEKEEVAVSCADGDVQLKGTDLCKLAVVERHFASGNIGLGLVKGYGLKGGAIGISVAHDSHNLVVLGDDNGDMVRVIELLRKSGGGMALVCGEEERVFPLDIGGLMTSLSAEEALKGTEEITERAKQMGIAEGYEPFMTLAFLSLAVIPKLKLTDRGLFDVESFSYTDVEV